jgi:hypothetical protein
LNFAVCQQHEGQAPRDVLVPALRRILRLRLLARDVIEAIVTGRADRSLMLEKLGRPLPARWERQRRRIG